MTPRLLVEGPIRKTFGRLYQHGKYVGDTSMTQVSVGFQLGGQAYSEIIFFQDRGALERFERGNFALSADASAVAITASASPRMKAICLLPSPAR